MAVTVYDPKKYLSFACCSTCSAKPCDVLRFGGVIPGKASIAYHRDFSPYTVGCPFKCDDPWEMREILEQMPASTISDFLDTALFYLSTAERLAHDSAHCIKTPDDTEGCIDYLIWLCEESVISLLRIPFFYESNAAMSAWLGAYEVPVRLIQTYSAPQNASSGPAVTDTMGSSGSSASAGGGQPATTTQEPESTDPISVIFRLSIDPDAPESQDDAFTLYSTDAMRSYRQTKTVRDDKTPGDGFTNIEFTGVFPNLRYSLEVDPGKEGSPYFIFENRPGKELRA